MHYASVSQTHYRIKMYNSIINIAALFPFTYSYRRIHAVVSFYLVESICFPEQTLMK